MTTLLLFNSSMQRTFFSTVIVWTTFIAATNAASAFANNVNPQTSLQPTAAASPDIGVKAEIDVQTDVDFQTEVEEAWEYSPYRVKIWIVGADSKFGADPITTPLTQYLDRAFASVWRMSISDAPGSIRVAARRDFGSLTYDSVTAADPVLAIKRDHPEAPRLRTAPDVATYVKRLVTTPDRLAAILRLGQESGRPTLDGVDKIIETITGDAVAVSELWKDPATEGVILSRGMADDLKSPEAKIIRLPIDDLVAEEIESNDKIFIVHIESQSLPYKIEVVELDCLMRYFSPVVTSTATSAETVPEAVGQAIIEAFAPMVRIEDAGQKTAVGLMRAVGLVPESTDGEPLNPALIVTGDFLLPMVRKNDRNGNPIMIGPIAWAYLHVTEVQNAKVTMDLYAGRVGGLQGRKNKRTFRMAIRTRPVKNSSVIRLHAQSDANEPLVGYEIYEKELKSIDMTFVGRTNWDGKITIDKKDTNNPRSDMRLLYVKNGGAILARLPIVPGLYPVEVADLIGDDQRLRAEAYIRGTQNAIVDLIAIRTLLAARIRLRLEKGKLDEAKELFVAIEREPSYDTIADDMGKKVNQIKGRNAGEQKKIDLMFAQTREMLVQNINSKLIRDLETEIKQAEANGGVLKRADPNE